MVFLAAFHRWEGVSAVSRDRYGCNSDELGHIAHQRFPDVASCQQWASLSHSLPSIGCCPPIGSPVIYRMKYSVRVIFVHASLILSEHLRFET